ncbi:MAG TPA: NAD(P)/FAD-dependent oxidoreductase [Streptosporangiaceae bacterium]|nr:NAD(P)/FAD-dependent oxidoreductase [Streptosporangiaceae bacterium]
MSPLLDADLLLVGAGPAGLFGAYYAGFRGLRTVVVDALPELGGQITAMYPEKLIHDVAGFPAVRGRDLVAGLIAQATPFSPTYLLGETAAELRYADGLPEVHLSGGRAVRAKAVVITGGIGRFTPRPLPVGQEFHGRGLEYFVTRPEDHARRDLVIVGGGDSALDWARALHPLARSVTLVHRRERFRAHQHTVDEVCRSPVRVLTDSEVVALHGNGRVQAVDVAHRPSGAVRRLPADTVVAALGFVADLGPLRTWGLELRARRIAVGTDMATNLPRVYAAGDIVAYPGKVRLIASGFGEVATAVNNAAVRIDPERALFPGHSTDAPVGG